MTYLVPQLNQGTPLDGDNCGPASVASALRWSTAHDVEPSPPEVRSRFGDKVGGTQMADHVKAYDSYTREASDLGWELKPAIYHDRDAWEKLLADLDLGRAMTLAIDYSRVPKHLKGDPKFDGLHAVFVSKVRDRGEQTEIRVWDPLCDGRRPGIPRGPLWYPKLTLKAAAAGYAGAGRATWVTVRKAKNVKPPFNPCEAALDEAMQRLDRATSALEAARSALVNVNQDIGAVIADIDEVLGHVPAGDDTRVVEGVLPPG